MKMLLKVLIWINLAVFIPLLAEDVTTVKAISSDIGENLDLEAVATIFGDSHNLQEFERKLNDPRLNVSNLDLNGDGYVDYLRVMDASEDGVFVVVIQAVIAKGMFQDVATIDIVKDRYGYTIVQVIGNIYLYGPNYIIQPVYATPPLILVWFSSPYYIPWFSPWYWDFYPSYYRPLQPILPRHHPNVKTHKNTYKHLDWRQSRRTQKLQNRISRDDWTHPSFTERNKGMKNRHELRKRPDSQEYIKSNGTDTQIPVSVKRKHSQEAWQKPKDRNKIDGREKSIQMPVYQKREGVDSPANRVQTHIQRPASREASRPHIMQKSAIGSEEEESPSRWRSK